MSKAQGPVLVVHARRRRFPLPPTKGEKLEHLLPEARHGGCRDLKEKMKIREMVKLCLRDEGEDGVVIARSSTVWWFGSLI